MLAFSLFAAAYHILLKDLVKFVFEQNFVGITKFNLFVEAIELDVWSPGEEDQKQSPCDQHDQDGQETFQGAEHKTFNVLKRWGKKLKMR